MWNHFFRCTIILLTISSLTACARLPEYAKPRLFQIDEMHKVSSTDFTYRPLTLEDFRAVSLPEDLSRHGNMINAQSAIQIRVTADSNLHIRHWPLSDPRYYLGSVNHLAFEAVMMPDHSWWNPKIKAAQTSYVLDHEQIHFALTELAARKLTSDIREWASNLSVKDQTPQKVYSKIVQQIKDKIKLAMEANQKRHLEFDQDTSLFYAPSWQAWWFQKVEGELKQTESAAHDR
jgi:hypothetical protein